MEKSVIGNDDALSATAFSKPMLRKEKPDIALLMIKSNVGFQ